MKKSRIKTLSTMAAVKHDASTDLVRGELQLFIGDTPIAFSSSCSLDISVEEIDISNKMCGSWAASLPGKKSFTLSCEALLTRLTGAMSYDTLLEKISSDEVLEFFFGEATVTNRTNTGGEFAKDPTKKNYTGKCMITSLSLKSDNGQIASCSASFKGVGSLESAEPSA